MLYCPQGSFTSWLWKSTNSQAENYFSQGIRKCIKTTDFSFIIYFKRAYMLIFSSHSTELYLNVDLQLLTIFIASSKYSSSDIEQKKYLFPIIWRYVDAIFSIRKVYLQVSPRIFLEGWKCICINYVIFFIQIFRRYTEREN